MLNTHPDTGVRFGVIALNNLDSDLASDLLWGPQAKDLSYKAAYDEAQCQAAGQADEEAGERGFVHGSQDWDAYVEDRTDELMDQFSETYHCEEPLIEGEYGGVEYRISWLGGAPLLWVIEGPIGTARSLCSPCVPNAADLDSDFSLGTDLDYECYVVPRDWLAKTEAQLELIA